MNLQSLAVVDLYCQPLTLENIYSTGDRCLFVRGLPNITDKQLIFPYPAYWIPTALFVYCGYESRLRILVIAFFYGKLEPSTVQRKHRLK